MNPATASLPPPLHGIDTVAIVGCGVVGCGWIPVFTGAGCQVRLYDLDSRRLTVAQQRLAQLGALIPSPDGRRGSVTLHTDLASAVAGAGYIQESVGEDLRAKQALFKELDALADPRAYLASSTSSLDINAIASQVTRPHRCFTAHPFNPAAVVPVVEILGTTRSRPEDLAGITAFLRRTGQMPIVLGRFVPGYVGNRLQAAIMREALSLVVEGITDADGIDAVVSHALALRWVPLGVFGTNHTNDENGLRGYYGRFWQSYRGLMDTLANTAPNLDTTDIESIAATVERRFESASVAQVSRWRDEFVQELRRLQMREPFRP